MHKCNILRSAIGIAVLAIGMAFVSCSDTDNVAMNAAPPPASTTTENTSSTCTGTVVNGSCVADGFVVNFPDQNLKVAIKKTLKISGDTISKIAPLLDLHNVGGLPKDSSVELKGNPLLLKSRDMFFDISIATIIAQNLATLDALQKEGVKVTYDAPPP